jgi:hypothetical protein
LLVLYPGETNLGANNDARNQVGKNQRLLKKLGKEREGSRDDEYKADVGEKAMLIHRKIITAKRRKSERAAQRANTLLGDVFAKSAIVESASDGRD